MTTYTLKKASGMIAFSSSFPEKIIPIKLAAGESIICQKTAFLCAERSVKLEVHFKKKFGAGLFGGEGLFLTTLEGSGKIWLQSMPIGNLATKIIPYIPSDK